MTRDEIEALSAPSRRTAVLQPREEIDPIADAAVLFIADNIKGAPMVLCILTLSGWVVRSNMAPSQMATELEGLAMAARTDHMTYGTVTRPSTQ